MTQPKKIELALDLGSTRPRREALRYARDKCNRTVLLADFLQLYPARAGQSLPADYLARPLHHFLITPIDLGGGGVAVGPEAESGQGTLRAVLDEAYQADMARAAEPEAYPERLSDNEAVHIAYRHELEQAARFLQHDLSVLIVCDKMLTEHIYEYVCKRAGKTPVLENAVPPQPGQGDTRQAFDRAMQGGGGPEANLPLLIRSLKANQALVLRSVDILDSPGLIEALYQGRSGDKKPQLLGFLDPSVEVKKSLADRFAVRLPVMGLPRYIQPDRDRPPVPSVTRLMTAAERQCFITLDPEGLYKNVSGLNAIQFRNAMRYVGATLAPGSPARQIYEVIRQFKTATSNEIEIPDTTFDHIGGYERVKQELQRIIALVSGRVQGINDRERARLIPRGFIFHGPPGTGKTLFAKAIANEMNATIQMVSGPEIMDKYVGQSESNLRQIFATARRNAPSVIFFDEFDSLASQRSAYSDGGARANNAVVAQLLTELDGFREEQAVLVIGTTNRLDIIDEALLRPSRLKPIEIGLPDHSARRRVARIHAENFGVDALIEDLGRLALDYLPAWRQSDGGEIPPAFLEALFEQHPPYRLRYERAEQQAGFRRELRAFFGLVEQAQTQSGPAAETDDKPARSVLIEMEKKLLTLARSHGLDLTRPARSESPDQPMQADIRELFNFVRQQQQARSGDFSPETMLSHLLDLIAEYTEGFNNDEIRAIFQEASLEHHLEGQLVTPRYLGMKIGLLKKRRDERQITHLEIRR